MTPGPTENEAGARWRRGPALTLGGVGALYALFVAAQWSAAYLDFGDGNYLYIATRMAEGVVVYRDILAPQPPAHLYVGMALVRLARWLEWDSPLFLVRGFSLVLRLATALTVADLGLRAWGRSWTGALAGGLYLVLPIGHWWSMGFQSEPLEVFFLVAMARVALAGSRARDVLVGLLGALAALTNVTAVPFLLALILFMGTRDRRRAGRIALSALGLAAGVWAWFEIRTGRFFDNVVLNQAGAFGSPQYTLGKLIAEGGDILWLEGGVIVLATLGLTRFLRESPLAADARDGLALFFLVTLFSFVYVAKSGTVDYIYCLAEPALAVLGAGELVALGGRAAAARRRGGAAVAVAVGGAVLLGLVVLGPAALYYRRLWTQAAYELPDLAHAGSDEAGRSRPNVEQVRRWIERRSAPGDVILAPPFYAFLTGRKIWGEYSEIFLWTVKNNRDRAAGNPEGEGWRKARELAEAIDRRELPIVIVELDQTGRFAPEAMQALERHYEPFYDPLPAEPYRTLNTRLGVYVPREP